MYYVVRGIEFENSRLQVGTWISAVTIIVPIATTKYNHYFQHAGFVVVFFYMLKQRHFEVLFSKIIPRDARNHA
jgi:hypothetical protein